MNFAASPYKHLEDPFHSSLDSFEGVPDFVPGPGAGSPRGWAHTLLAWVGEVLPGIALAFALACAGYFMFDKLLVPFLG